MLKLPDDQAIISAFSRFKSEGFFSEIKTAKSDNLFLKLENNLVGGSYKIRGVRQYIETQRNRASKISVLSAGNLALACAIEASKLSIPCQAIVPIGVSEIKKKKLLANGAEVVEIPFTELWELVNQAPEEISDTYLHPLDINLLCGYATMALEIQEQFRGYNSLVVPFGLGGLTLALAAGDRLNKTESKIYAVEISGHSPLCLALKNARPMLSPKLNSFIEALGTPCVLPLVFEKIKNYSIEVVNVTVEETKEGIRELYYEHGIRAEGAAGACYAASKKIAQDEAARVVSILSGGNISESVLAEILRGTA